MGGEHILDVEVLNTREVLVLGPESRQQVAFPGRLAALPLLVNGA